MTLGRQYSMYCDPLKMYTVVSVKCLFQCLRILEVNLNLEVRMSFKKYTILLITDWQHFTSNRVHNRLVLSYFHK